MSKSKPTVNEKPPAPVAAGGLKREGHVAHSAVVVRTCPDDIDAGSSQTIVMDASIRADDLQACLRTSESLDQRVCSHSAAVVILPISADIRRDHCLPDHENPAQGLNCRVPKQALN
jgi:hypothetical protein